tara:strand:+ start:21702 stop:22445 length:744 start_codon:yes stop_codon:yes gene_type:complete
MGRFAALILSVTFCTSLFAQIAIVTDLDDTVKRTNVQEPEKALYNALFTQKIFSGMNDLLDEMSHYVDDVFILSASPRLFNYNIEKLLEEHEIEHKEYFTRDGLEDKAEYKYEKIVSVIESGYEKVILIGDDIELDPVIYERVKTDYPDKVLAIYIHRVTNQALPESSIPYYTAFDLAHREFAAGRMSEEQVAFMGQAILDEPEFERAFPEFTHCPKSGFEGLGLEAFEGLEEVTELVDQRIINYCR